MVAMWEWDGVVGSKFAGCKAKANRALAAKSQVPQQQIVHSVQLCCTLQWWQVIRQMIAKHSIKKT